MRRRRKPERSRLPNVVIRNIGSYEDLWKQVSQAWKKNIPVVTGPLPALPAKELKAGEFSVSRGKPKDSEAIAGADQPSEQGRATPDR